MLSRTGNSSVWQSWRVKFSSWYMNQLSSQTSASHVIMKTNSCGYSKTLKGKFNKWWANIRSSYIHQHFLSQQTSRTEHHEAPAVSLLLASNDKYDNVFFSCGNGKSDTVNVLLLSNLVSAPECLASTTLALYLQAAQQEMYDWKIEKFTVNLTGVGYVLHTFKWKHDHI